MSIRPASELSRRLTLFKHFQSFWNAGSDLLFPPTCTVCSARSPLRKGGICAPCDEQFYSPMELTVPGAEVERARAIAAGFYEGPLRDLVLRVKFHADPRPLPLLKDFLRRASDQLVRTLPTTIIAVPADRRRLRKRGVDLPALLAKDLALHLRVPFERNIVRKVRATSAQTSLDQKERRGNLEGAFEVVADPAEQNILVVDDVFTTGATAGVVTELLLCSGAHAVIWATLARTPLSLKVIEEP